MANDIRVEVSAHDILKVIRILVKKKNYSVYRKLTDVDKSILRLLISAKKAIDEEKKKENGQNK